MNIEQTRRKNLKSLIREAFRDSQAEFAEKIERTEPQVSQWLLGGTGGRNMSERTARRIEQVCGLPFRYLDRDENAPIKAQEPFTLYSLDPTMQSEILRLFEKLAKHQREEMLDKLRALARANEIVIREVGPRLDPPCDQHVAKYLAVPQKK